MPTTQFCTMQMGINAFGACDLVIVSTGNGRGRIAIDRTPASALLIAIGTDRRAEPEDVTPDMLTAPQGAVPGLYSRRGWVGDILLPDGERLGSRLWLYERAKRTEQTRQDVVGAMEEAVAPIAAYHDLEIDCAASWATPQGAGAIGGLLRGVVRAGPTSIAVSVPTL